MKTSWTLEEWEAGRAERREISDTISNSPCGRKPTNNKRDRELLKNYGGKRNLPFSTLEKLKGSKKKSIARIP
jgi:hypothetical protein